MSSTEELRQRIEKLISENTAHTESKQELLESEMESLVKRGDHAEQVELRIFNEIIEPRLHLVQESVEDAGYQRASGLNSGMVQFNKSRKYSATIEMRITLSHDPACEQLLVDYELTILPIFMKYIPSDQLSLPFDGLNEKDVVDFSDENIAICVETYFRLQNNAHYQKANRVTDPVCGMVINRVGAISCEHNGKPYYFCAQACKDRFLQKIKEELIE